MSSLTSALVVPLLAATLAVPVSSPQSQVQNGRVEHRGATSMARDVAALVSASSDPVWIAWREPMVDGERSLCCWYSDNNDETANGVRGCMVDGSTNASNSPQLTPPSGPVRLEAGTGVVMMLRAVDKRIERLRVFSDECQLDAGGRRVYWLDGVSPQDSVRFLESLTAQPVQNIEGQRNLVNASVRAAGLHRDPAADTLLDRLAASDGNASLRRQAAIQLGSLRGSHGFETLRRLVDAERQPDIRRSFVNALGQSVQPEAADLLLRIARQDTEPRVRGEAVYWYGRRAGTAGAANVRSIIEADADQNVKNRGVAALASLPNNAGVAPLIDLARTSPQQSVRKEAVTALGRTKDPRAVAYLEELLRR